jgi:hypothetical protein
VTDRRATIDLVGADLPLGLGVNSPHIHVDAHGVDMQ